MGSTSEMHGPLRVRERRAGRFDEETPCICEFHNPSLIASEQVELMLCFEVRNLLLSAGWVICSRSAARRKFSSSAKAMTASR